MHACVGRCIFSLELLETIFQAQSTLDHIEGTFGTRGPAASQFDGPFGVCVDARNAIVYAIVPFLQVETPVECQNSHARISLPSKHDIFEPGHI